MPNFKTVREIVLGTKPAKFGGGLVQVRASLWEGSAPPSRGLGIREFWENDNGEWCPSRNGISLRLDQLPQLAELIDLCTGEAPPLPEPVDPASVDLVLIAGSRYPGRCCICGEPYAVGDSIGLDPDGAPGRKAAHWECVEPEDEAPSAAAREEPSLPVEMTPDDTMEVF